MFASHSVALLPTNTTINPSKPYGAEFFSPDDSSLLVLRSRRTGGLTVAQTYGNTGNHVGDVITAHHDQAMYTFGQLTVVAVRRPGGDYEGDVPTKRLKLRVYK